MVTYAHINPFFITAIRVQLDSVEIAKDLNVAGKCINCPPGGFYHDEMATTSCKYCPKGQFVPPGYGPGRSPLDCLTCPKGTDTNVYAIYRACKCLDGFARTYHFGECQLCNVKETTKS